MSAPGSENYYCYGSTEPETVHKCFDRLLPIWQCIPLHSDECNRLEEARNQIGQTSTTHGLAQRIRSAWLAQDLQPGEDNYSLGVTLASPIQLLTFVRSVEQIILEAKSLAVLAYWSRNSAAQLIPDGPRYRALMGIGSCLCIFSEERQVPTEEWCFWTESSDLCLILYVRMRLGSVIGPLPPMTP